jgi:uncharacterized membrane protein YcaP (DUF421 family)
MESIYRAVFMYFFLMIVLRILGNRTLNEMTMFDFILVLIIGDSSQQAITGSDYSIINAVIIIITFIIFDLLLSLIKNKFSKVERIVDGIPIILINKGELQRNAMERLKIDESDILESARKLHGIENFKQIKYAILEKDGDISIIPNRG